jgi:hypothetical protein
MQFIKIDTMRTLLLISSIACFTTAVQAQAPAPGSSSNKDRSADTSSNNQSGPPGSSPRANVGSGMRNPKAMRSDAVSQMLGATNDARKAISNNNKQQAQNDVSQALKAAEGLSTGSVKEFVPLYTEISRYSVVAPLEAALGKQPANAQQGAPSSTADANSASTKPGGQQSSNTAKDANDSSEKVVAVRKVVGEYTSVWLNAKVARTHLQSANDALKSGDMQAADRALEAVQRSVVLEFVAADMPLLKARENLMLARRSASSGDYTQAHSALQAASNALSTYEKGGSTHVNEARKLRAEIDDYNKSLEQNHSDSASKIESWWNQTTDWMTAQGSSEAGSASNTNSANNSAGAANTSGKQ